MCYHYKLSSQAKLLENRFQAEFEYDVEEELYIYANGFTHLKMPIITSDKQDVIQQFHWGLIPHWVKDATKAKELANMCLNAKIETVLEKPSFRESAKHKRCIIPATSFIEWKWLDSKGHQKEQYEISLSNNELFAFGGIWSDWTHTETGEIVETFSIVTTSANTLMAEIHNTKKRMPIILKTDEVKTWLNNPIDADMFSHIAQKQNLTALLQESHKKGNTLF